MGAEDTLETGRHLAITTAGLPAWRFELPTLRAPGVTLREVSITDAPALHAAASEEEALRFLESAAESLVGVERWIERIRAERRDGRALAYVVIPDGETMPAGVFQLNALEPGFAVADWQFALDSAYWGHGLFYAAAPLFLEFAFATVGVRRLEARALVQNGRGNGALRKLGAVQEALLRQSVVCDGVAFDQVMWAILADDWRARGPIGFGRVH